MGGIQHREQVVARNWRPGLSYVPMQFPLQVRQDLEEAGWGPKESGQSRHPAS